MLDNLDMNKNISRIIVGLQSQKVYLLDGKTLK